MNSVNLIGRWVRDHESITAGQQGTTLVKNTIAVDHPFKKDSPSFLRVVMWGKTGELANQYTGKGSQIAVEGHLETGSYDDKDGKRVFMTEVVADSVQFLEPRNASADRAGTGNEAPAQQYQQPSQQTYTRTDNDPFNTGGGPIEVSDDDLPF